MSGEAPFQAQSATYAIAVTTAASAPIQIPTNAMQYMLANVGTDGCFVAISSTPLNASVPTPGTPEATIYIAPGSVVSITGSPQAFVSSICAAGSTTLYVGAGEGQFPSVGGGSGGGVTSVGLALPALFTVTGSPVTASGTLTGAFASQTANTFLAAPNGASGVPTMRAIVSADVPVFVASGTSHAAGAVPDPGATAGTTRFLREDATWATPTGGGSSGAGVQHLPPSMGANYGFVANCVYPQGAGLLTLSAGLIYYVPFIVDRTVTITQLGFFYDSTNANTVSVGIYSDSSNAPGTLLTSGSVAASAAQMYAVSVPSITLSAGVLYWAAIVLPTTSSQVFGSSQCIFSLGSYFTNGSGAATNVTYTTRAQSGTALPATGAASSLSPGNFPLIWFNG